MSDCHICEHFRKVVRIDNDEQEYIEYFCMVNGYYDEMNQFLAENKKYYCPSFEFSITYTLPLIRKIRS